MSPHHTHFEAPVRLLLVEDDPYTVEVVREVLPASTFVITHVDTGQAAISAFREEPPDIVLLDIGLPDMDGLDVLGSLCSEPYCPVVVLTGRDDRSAVVSALRAGACDFLDKTPDYPDILPFTLQSCLDKHRLAAENRRYQMELERSLTERTDQLKATRNVLTSEMAERERTEENLENTEAVYRTLFNASADAIYLLDSAGVILEANHAAASMLGYTTDDLAGMHIADLNTAMSPERVMARHASIFEGGGAFFQTAHRAADGTFIPVEVNARVIPYLDAPGNRVVLAACRDITDRRRMEDSMRTAEEKCRSMFAGAGLGMVQLSPAGQIREVNSAFCHMVGYDRTDLLGMGPPYDVWPEDSVARFTAEMEAVRINGRGVIEGEVLRKDGSRLPVRVDLSVYRDHLGKQLGTIAFVADISREVALREDLRTTASQLSIILDQLPVFPFLCGCKEGFPFTFAGANAQWLTGFAPERFTDDGLFWRSRVDPEHLRAVDARLAQLRPGGTVDVEFRLRHADESWRWVRAIFRHVTEDGSIYCIGVFLDIDAAKRTEMELLATSERLEFALVGANDGLWDWKLATQDIYFSPRWFTLLGYEPDQFPHSVETFKRLVFPGDLPKLWGRVEDYLAGRIDRFEVEFRMFTADGGWKWVLGRGKVVERDADGQPVRFVGTHVDIDTRRRMEEELREAKRVAEEANRIKSEFLANMSHELRTPMNAIIGMTELTLDGEVGGEEHEQLQTVLESSHNLLDLLNELLDFARVEAGQMQLDEVAFAVEAFLQSVVRPYETLAAKKGLALTLQVDEALPPVLVGDPAKLRQVLVNLLGNALKFTEAGEVGVEVRLAEYHAAEKRGGADHVVVQGLVRDTGPGISLERQSVIFESFTQGDASATRKHGGTGLGLAISRAIVEMMGGAIRVASQPGQGATFSFTARLQVGGTEDVVSPDDGQSGTGTNPGISRPQAALAPPVGSAAATRSEGAGGTGEAGGTGDAMGEDTLYPGSLNILLVEDNPINRTMARKYLQRAGHCVYEAENGERALSLLTAERPIRCYDLVLMDIQMPRMDGMTATRTLRQHEATRELPVIAMTAHAMRGDRERFLEAGMDDYISKPVNMRELEAVMTRVMEGRPRCGSCTGEGLGDTPASDPQSGAQPSVQSGAQAGAQLGSAGSARKGAAGHVVVPPHVLDRENALARLGGEEEFLHEMFEVFLGDVQASVGRIQRRLEEDDLSGLGRAAHSFKGAAGAIGAVRVEQLARDLEFAGKEGHEDVARDKVAELTAAVDEVVELLQRLVVPDASNDGDDTA